MNVNPENISALLISYASHVVAMMRPGAPGKGWLIAFTAFLLKERHLFCTFFLYFYVYFFKDTFCQRNF